MRLMPACARACLLEAWPAIAASAADHEVLRSIMKSLGYIVRCKA